MPVCSPESGSEPGSPPRLDRLLINVLVVPVRSVDQDRAGGTADQLAAAPLGCVLVRAARTTLQHVERHRRDGNDGRRRGCGVLQQTGARRQQIEQQPHAGPFAGPKPEPMMVPRGAKKVKPPDASESARVGAQIPSKLVMRVRFSSPALSDVPSQGSFRYAAVRLHQSALGPGHNVGP